MSKWWTLVAVCLATFMLLLDVTIVNVALPSIERDLHASFSDVQWVVDAYALTLAAGLLTLGSLGDVIGRRLVFTVGVGIPIWHQEFSYAWEPLGDFGNAHYFSLVMHFGEVRRSEGTVLSPQEKAFLNVPPPEDTLEKLDDMTNEGRPSGADSNAR